MSSEKEKAAVFSKYFERLYNPTVNVERDLLREYEINTGNEEWAPMTETEVYITLKSMKN